MNFLSFYSKLIFFIVSLFIIFPLKVNAVSMSPAIIEVTIEAGQTENFTLNVSSLVSQPITYYTSTQNFEPRGETGYPYFTTTNQNLATWITAPSEVVLEPDILNEVQFSITVPEDTPAAGYFAALFLGNQPNSQVQADQDSEVVLGGKVGVLILLTVPGDIIDQAGIIEFDTTDGKRLFNSVPIATFYRFSNAGADRVVPTGHIEFKNLLSFKPSQQFEVNQQQSSVLPSSTRLFEQTLGAASTESGTNFVSTYFKTAQFQFKNFHLGIYNVYLKISWGQSLTSKDSSEFTIIIFPWQLLSLILMLVLLAFLGIKRYNAWLLRLSQPKYAEPSLLSPKPKTTKSKPKPTTPKAKKIDKG